MTPLRLHALRILNITFHISVIQLPPFCCLLSYVNIFQVLLKLLLVAVDDVFPSRIHVVFIAFIEGISLPLLLWVLNIMDTVKAFVFVVGVARHVMIVIYVDGTAGRHVLMQMISLVFLLLFLLLYVLKNKFRARKGREIINGLR